MWQKTSIGLTSLFLGMASKVHMYSRLNTGVLACLAHFQTSVHAQLLFTVPSADLQNATGRCGHGWLHSVTGYFFFRDLFLFYLYECLPACMNVYHVYMVPLLTRRGQQSPWNWIY